MKHRRTALVTGATTGIGAAIAAELVAAGYRLCITGLDQAELSAAAATLPPDTFAVAGDLADTAFVQSLVPAVRAAGIEIDLLVNNAAWRDLRSMRDIDMDSWERTLRVCLTAPTFLARDVAKGMESRGGVIINISSITANRGYGGATAYIAAKAGLDAVTRDLAILYGGSGVRVIGVAPGAVDTALSADIADGDLAAAVRNFSVDMIPAGRWANPVEVARTVVALASDDFAYLTGTTITLDGGWSAALYPQSLRDKMNGEAPS